ncbi:helix-turn-helix domain-containing protein [Burkholderia pseudomallei]|uniref:helix-turn-helix domain-containing protein n=1 Tax=Burkholderia pseudomallei TaxID=28450 RepID=UPI0005317B8E|nr:helix-turn-helix domain-containing protein [Burkholderia pseudomallei]KGS63012.1 merR HTH regulatory family protein [Burkholderia pseudomallei MSHR4868]KGW22268.1 merR HTH regulatory family protein [Burkholderia pseudomallei MSHR733]RAQ86200.1 hypothetical protein A4G85_14000 [Burkholderia pseudomallei]
MKSNDFPDLLTTSEAARAMRRSPQALRMWIARGNGPIKPAVAISGRYLWRRDDVERLLHGEPVQQS